MLQYKTKYRVSPYVSACLLTAASPALANPTGGAVVGGSASIDYGTTTTITQSTDSAIINWQDFSIDIDETTQFMQPSSGSVTLNRVVGDNFSNIQGKLTATGTIFLINPNGVVFGPNAQVNVTGLVTSTANITNDDFMAGNYRFADAPDASYIENNGTISVAQAGMAVLVAPSVKNYGVINANLADVVLASGKTYTLDLYGDNLITFDASVLVKSGLVENLGTITAQGGNVLLTAQTADAVLESMINVDGYIDATYASSQNGKVVIQGYKNSQIKVAGTIDVSGGNGVVHTYADNINVVEGSTINADGGDYGNGGEVIFYANNNLDFSSDITARGGLLAGDGGFVETSAANQMNFLGGTILVGAPFGAKGLWLTDPDFITVNNALASSYQTTLQSGGDVIAQADIDITFENTSPITWGSPDGDASSATFTATAGDNIVFDTGGTAALASLGSGNIILNTDTDLDGVADGTITFTSGSITYEDGNVDLFYNPTTFGSYNDYSSDITTSTGTGTVTHYMLVQKGLGTDITDRSLEFLSNSTNNTTHSLWGKNYALANDISGDNVGNTALAENINSFSGIFDGQGFTISDFNYASGGIFGTVTGTLKDINVDNVNIVATDVIAQAGILAGTLGSGGVIEGNVTVSNSSIQQTTANATSRLGGIVGDAQSGSSFGSGAFTVSNITIDIDAGTVQQYIGGVVGFLSTTFSTTASFTSSGSIEGITSVGGIFGAVSTGPVTTGTLSSTATVTGLSTVNGVGGIVGLLQSASMTADMTFNGTVNASGGSAVGGVIGWITGSSSLVDATKTLTLGATGSVSAVGANNVGGIIGSIDNSPSGTFTAGMQTLAGASVSGSDNTGGIIGNFQSDTETFTPNGTLTNAATVTGADDVGGVFGALSGLGSSITPTANATAMSNSGNIVGANNVGGVIGNLTSNAYLSGALTNTGDVTASAARAGGIAGNVANSWISGDLTVSNASIKSPTGDGNSVNSFAYLFAAVTGAADIASTNVSVTNTSFDLQATTNLYVGGIVGAFGAGARLSGFNTSTWSIPDVSASNASYVGGIMGALFDGEVHVDDDLTSLSNVTGNSFVGGVIGQVFNFAGTAPTVRGDLTLDAAHTVTGVNDVGGVIGIVEDDSKLNSALTANGDVVGTGSDVGGLIGSVNETTQIFGSTTMNTGSGASITGNQYVGGFIGNLAGFNTFSLGGVTHENAGTVTISGAGSTGGGIFGTIAGTGTISLGSGGKFLHSGTVQAANGVTIGAVGGIVGIVSHATFGGVTGFTLENSGTVSGASTVGGLFGDINDTNAPTFTNMTFTAGGTVTGTGDDVGGGIGLLDGATVLPTVITSTANVSGVNNVGGIFGRVTAGSLTGTYNYNGNFSGTSAKVLGTGSDVGGIAGELSGTATVSGSFTTASTARIEGVNNVGGKFGYVDGTNLTSLSSASFTNQGVVVGTGTNIGGLAGYAKNASFGSLSSSSLFVTGSGGSTTNVGGLLGLFEGGSVSGATTSASVNADTNVGGIFGQWLNANVTTMPAYTTTSTSVIGDNSVGGLIGYLNTASAFNAQLTASTGSTLTLNIGGNGSGGVIGRVSGSTITTAGSGFNTQAAGTHTANLNSSNIGGLIGYIENSTFNVSEAGDIVAGSETFNMVTYAGGIQVVGDGTSSVGGIVGSITGSTVNLTGSGTNTTGTLRFNYMKPLLNEETGVSDVGGFVGLADNVDFNVITGAGSSFITGNTINTTNALIFNNVGGFVGRSVASTGATTYTGIYNINNTLSVGSNSTDVGGFIGESASGTVFEAGLLLQKTGGITTGGTNVGGHIGNWDVGTYSVGSNSTWTNNTSTSGVDNVGGFFGTINATNVNNITIANTWSASGPTSASSGIAAGIVPVMNHNFTFTSNLQNTGSVSATGDNIGTLFGSVNNTTFSGGTLTASGGVSGGNNVGGMFGSVGSGTSFTNVTFSVSGGFDGITGTNNVGGIFGLLNGGSFSNAMISNISGRTVTSNNSGTNVGMIAGQINGVTPNFTAASGSTITLAGVTVTGANNAGGLVGLLDNASLTGNYSLIANADKTTTPTQVKVSGNSGGLLAGYMQNGSNITGNIVITDSKITSNGTAQYLGGIVGTLADTSRITMASLTYTNNLSSSMDFNPASGGGGDPRGGGGLPGGGGSSNTATYVGGYIGRLYNATYSSSNPLDDLSSYTAVTNTDGNYTGAIIGLVENSTIGSNITLSTTHNVTGGSQVGGVIGGVTGASTLGGVFINNAADITGTGQDVGGIIGLLGGTSTAPGAFTVSNLPDNAFAVTGGSNVGALVGRVATGATLNPSIVSVPASVTESTPAVGLCNGSCVFPGQNSGGSGTFTVTRKGVTLTKQQDNGLFTTERILDLDEVVESPYAYKPQNLMQAVVLYAATSFVEIGAQMSAVNELSPELTDQMVFFGFDAEDISYDQAIEFATLVDELRNYYTGGDQSGYNGAQ